MEKILVTGGAGYAGSILVDKLLDEQYKVKVLDNLMYNQTSHLPFFINKNFEFVRGDIRDKETVSESLKDVDLILHLAAIVGAPACKKNTKLAEEVNIEGTRIINSFRSNNQTLIYASTGSNYGKLDEICTEESPLNPTSLYAKTKCQAEDEIMSRGNSVALRFATAFGVSPRFRYDSLLINDLVYQALNNRYLVIYEADAKRTFIHVRDMAESYLFTIDNLDKTRNNVFNVGSEKMNCSKRDVVSKIKEILKNKEKINLDIFFAEIAEDEDKRDYEVSYEKIRKIGFETKISLNEGIEELINVFKNLPFRDHQAVNIE